MKKPIILCGVGDVILPDIGKEELEGANGDLIQTLNQAYDQGYEVRLCVEANDMDGFRLVARPYDTRKLEEAGLEPEIVENIMDKKDLKKYGLPEGTAAVIDIPAFVGDVSMKNLDGIFFAPHEAGNIANHLGLQNQQPDFTPL